MNASRLNSERGCDGAIGASGGTTTGWRSIHSNSCRR
jgi:hypothetical protein